MKFANYSGRTCIVRDDRILDIELASCGGTMINPVRERSRTQTDGTAVLHKEAAT